MEDRYLRNRIYIQPAIQETIRMYKVILAGAGVGSAIAETLLRIGFENIVIVDQDVVETSNLNRQNYTAADIDQPKVAALRSRLLSINPTANITVHHCELTETNIEALLGDAVVAVNALDFTSGIPFQFDAFCKSKGITVLHPYNLGWAGLIFALSPSGVPLTTVANTHVGFEVKLVEYLLDTLEAKSGGPHWLRGVLKSYLNEELLLPPPQLSVGCSMLAAQCTSLIYKLAAMEPIKVFPVYYYYSIIDDK